MTWAATAPHNAPPALPPAAELESPTILKACIPARAALAELKQASELLPNQGLLINTLPLLEAQGSSAIEHIVTMSGRLFEFARQASQADPAYLKKLVEIGVLKEIARGKEKLFVHPRLIQLMTTDNNRFTEYARP